MLYRIRKEQFEQMLEKFVRRSKKEGVTISDTMKERLQKLLYTVAKCAAAEERHRMLKIKFEAENPDEIKRKIMQEAVGEILGY